MPRFPDRAESPENNPPREFEVNEVRFREYIEEILREVMPGYILPLRGKKPAQPDHLTYSNPYVVINQWVGLRGFDTKPPKGLFVDGLAIWDCINAIKTNELTEDVRLIAAIMALNDKLTLQYLELEEAHTNPIRLKAAKQQLLRSCYLLEKLLTPDGQKSVDQFFSSNNRISPTLTFQELGLFFELHLVDLTTPENIYLEAPIDFPSPSIKRDGPNPSSLEYFTNEFDQNFFNLMIKILKHLLFSFLLPGNIRLTDVEIQDLCKTMLSHLDQETQFLISNIIVRVVSNPQLTTIFAPGSIKVVAAETFRS